MKKNIFPILLTLLLGFVTISATAQSWNQKFDFDITYSSLNKQSKLASVFNLLASNNNKNVNNLRLQLSFEMHFHFSKTANGQFILHHSGYGQQMTGNVLFRNFKVDSLLLPKKLAVELLFYNNNHLIDTLIRTISLAKGRVALPFTGNITLSALSVKMKVNRIIYTSNNYHRFLQTAGLINHYYGYDKIMQEMPRLLMGTSGADQPPASHFFLNYVMLTRLEYYVRRHNLTQRLHLSQNDPLGFNKTFKTIIRRQIRMETLSQQQLQQNSPSVKDKESFSRGYVALSIKAMALSQEQQPYIATSFSEFAQLFPNNKEADFVRQIQTYYDQNKPSGQATVSQEIYKYFINASSLKIHRQSFVRALYFLVNAAYFENHFSEVKRITKFDSCLIHTRDGLATSYLKVALMASENHDIQLSDRYKKKASQSLNTDHTIINPPKVTPCYPHYSREMLRMAEASLEQGYFHKALSFIHTAHLACHKLPGVDSLRTAICERLLNQRLAVSRKLLKQSNLIASRDTLLQIAKDYPGLCPSNIKLTQNKYVTETATAIFRQIVSAGAQLHVQNRNVQAITYLSSAAHLQRIFSLPYSPQLNTLIAETTIPYILSVANKANMEIWKRHFQKADSIYRLAQNLSRHYGLAKNKKIKNRLNALSDKIKIAGCQWKKEEISRFFTQTNRAVSAYQMAAARSYFLKAKHIYAGTASCFRDNSQMGSTFNTYENLFRFAEEYHRLTLQLFSKGFASVLPGFVRLEKQYNAYRLEQFDLPFTSLYTFVRNQQSEILIMEAVHYFIRQKEFTLALQYLQLSENPDKAKAEQKQIAMGFAQNGLAPDSRLLQDPAFAYFAKVWRKRKLN